MEQDSTFPEGSAIEKDKQNSPMELNSHLKLLFMENNVTEIKGTVNL